MRQQTPSSPSDRDVGEQVRDRLRTVEEQGKQVWNEFEADVGPRARYAGYVGAIVVNAILLAIAHGIPSWKVGFITAAFAEVLWAIDLSLGATIVVNALFLVDDTPWFRDLAHIALNVLALVSGYTLYRIFPFDFGTAFWNDFARTGLVVVLAALVLGTVVETIRFLVDEVGRSASR